MKLFFSFILLMVGVPAFAEDHLEPEQSQFSGIFMPQYYGTVLEAYSETYDKEFVARAIVFPSFQPEYAVAIKKQNEEFKVVHLQTKKQFWARIMEGKVEEEYEVDRCEKEIDKVLANKIISIWEKMLLGTKYRNYLKEDNMLVGLDGTTYHFSMRLPHLPGRWMAGKTWSPQVESPTGLLVGISDGLVSYCSGENSSINDIEFKIEELQKIID